MNEPAAGVAYLRINGKTLAIEGVGGGWVINEYPDCKCPKQHKVQVAGKYSDFSAAEDSLRSFRATGEFLDV